MAPRFGMKVRDTQTLSSGRGPAQGASALLLGMDAAIHQMQAFVDAAGASAAADPFARVMWRVKGANAARLILLRSIAKAQGAYGPVAGTSPGGGYNDYLFLRDYYYSALPFPGFYTADIIRPVLAEFVRSIGGDGRRLTACCEHIDVDGTWRFAPGHLGEVGYAPALDNESYLALLLGVLYDRGDRVAFSQYAATVKAGLDGLPRDPDGSGLVWVNPGNYIVGWGFEDTPQDAHKGALGMASALAANGYQALERMARLERDVAMETACRAAAAQLVDGMFSTLRRPGGLFAPNTHHIEFSHVMFSALTVFSGWGTQAQREETGAALLAAYNSVSGTFGPAGAGGDVAQRGSVRHLLNPQYWPNGGENIYQNGAAWLGHWTAWLGYALSLADADVGQAFVQAAVDEILREYRVDGTGPWEWSYMSSRGTVLYPAAGTFLVNIEEDLDEVCRYVPVSGGEVLVDLPHGTSIVKWNGRSSGGGPTSVAVAAEPQVNGLFDPIPADPPAYGAAQGVVGISLPAGVDKQVGIINAAAFGGRLRLTPSGAEASTRIFGETATPAFEGVAAGGSVELLDPWTVSDFTNYDVVGDWVMGGGLLTTVDPDDASCCLYKALGAVVDGHFYFSFNSEQLATVRLPAFVMRAKDPSALTCIGLMWGSDGITVFQRAGGSFGVITTVGGVSTVDNEWYDYHLHLAGTDLTIYRNGVNVGTVTVPDDAVGGTFGVYIGSGGATGIVSHRQFAYSVAGGEMGGVSDPIPPGVVVTSGTNGFVAGEAFPAGAKQVRGPAGEVLATITDDMVKVTYP